MNDNGDAYNKAKVGDLSIDPYPKGCPSLGCARPPLHEGQHVAEIYEINRVVDVWPNEWAKVDTKWCIVHNSPQYGEDHCWDGPDEYSCFLVETYIRTNINFKE